MAVPSPPSKPNRRQAARDARRAFARALDADARNAQEAALAAIALPHLGSARAVAGYHPMRDEISPLAILDALTPGQAAALPWFADRDSRMMFRAAPATEPGPWGVLQPPGDAEALAPDIVLVPLVLADRHGTRIGLGKGHYDRALAHLRAASDVKAIGVAWDMQISEDALPADPWDAPLDAIVTPSRWIDCR
ncbi:5-formyltetrahydrofolate cyclo-ligase [Allosphingosinicella indica]|uniref:5-formyltetrahydrofolate cyclo-ligase n=1 Tax=Allosphingosinicella indica TaxID=941907 RepID=A0A1X7FY10_9SPHN|nr:5-formyltetrahydrofolate cyclo-ligase [Allosphingosinicella indica]SMF60789.1 5-formyltetrahydrofolate cyclo-ligase [Allosphingosinicella indica]